MAQAAKVNTIIGDLVATFVSTADKSDARKLKVCKDAASRGAKAHQYVRTNQFEVESTLNGLIEKFSIINRDDLADALTKRVIELKARSRSKWTPELLSLFLNLADRPDQKSSLAALELLRPPTPPPAPVTWEELEAEDPLIGDVWQDESYSSASEDELESTERAKSAQTPKHTNSVALSVENPAIITQHVPTTNFMALKAAQFWTQTDLRSSRPQLLSELQIIREVLLMLRGLPTSIFAIDEKHTLIYHATNTMLSQISLSGLNDVLQAFASIGSDLLRLRKWTTTSQSVTLLQTFNAAVSDCIRGFDLKVTKIEERFVQAQKHPIIISILEVHQEIDELSRPITALSELTASVPSSGEDFNCLELLYSQLCALQAAGDEACFNMLGGIFFECLNVHLKPVALWMQEGTILDNDESFFIALADKSSTLSSLWHDRYTLRMTNDGTLHAPSFLRPTAKKILNAGKSIVFLQHLRRDPPAMTVSTRSLLTFENTTESFDYGLPLIPFAELFSRAFTQWMDSKYSPASLILKEHLLSVCDLRGRISALEHFYFSKDGTIFQFFTDELFKRMMSGRVAWNDKFLLTELARQTFVGIKGFNVANLSVQTSALKSDPQRSVKVFAGIVLDVTLPWPIQNIIPRSSLTTYQAVFTLLLQISYAKYRLRNSKSNIAIAKAARLATGIRQELTWFANAVHSYVLETVVHSATEELHQHIMHAEDLDAICEVQQAFLRRIDKACLLAKNLAPIYESIISMLDLTVVFVEGQETVTKPAGLGDRKERYADPSRRGRRRQREEDDDQDHDTDDERNEQSAESDFESDSLHDDEDVTTETEPPVNKRSNSEQLQHIHDQFSQLLHFTVAGLRSISRAGGLMEWEMLAERLEWGLQRRRARPGWD